MYQFLAKKERKNGLLKRFGVLSKGTLPTSASEWCNYHGKDSNQNYPQILSRCFKVLLYILDSDSDFRYRYIDSSLMLYAKRVKLSLYLS